MSPVRPTPSAEEIAWKTGSGRCVVCGASAYQRHHVVEKQHLKRYAPDRLWALAGGTWLCNLHHELHTNAAERIEVRHLSDANLAFAFETLGDYAPLYIRRRYRGDDPRLARPPADFVTPLPREEPHGVIF